jgi:GT2 family glycosyltransferase
MTPVTMSVTPKGVEQLVLNFNGRAWLEDCLPSLREAAVRSPVPCRVTVVDNGSTDGSCELIARRWPDVGLVREENLGLASFNRVLARLDAPVVILLNNDVKLEPDAIGPLLRPFEEHDDVLFTAPQCWTFDGQTYEGMRTRVRTRFGLVQGMCRVPGHEDLVGIADLTAAAGPVLAVHRRRFLEIGGYDPIYFPGRIEDLDLGFRGWMAGYRGYYVPESVAYHRGFGTFESELGLARSDRLARRNTLIFVWKNTAGGRLLAHLLWLPVRFGAALVRGRLDFVAAVFEALGRLDRVLIARRELAVGGPGWIAKQEAFYRQFHW